MKRIILCIFICLLFIIPAVSANEDIDLNATDDMLGYSSPIPDNIALDEDNLGASEEPVLEADGTGNTFKDLEILINAHIASGEPLNLDKDYINSDNYNSNGITINGQLTINGNNFTIDANQKGRIFNIKDGSNVMLNNITFKNGKKDNGGAVYLEKNTVIEIHDSTFIDNTATKSGGAIRSNDGNCPVKVYDSNFINNVASEYGGALSIGKDSEIYGSNFTGNTAKKEGGAINVRSSGTAKSISDCVFENNNASYGGAIVFGGGKIENSNFISNNGLATTDGVTGGAVYSKGAVTVLNSSFTDNRLSSKKSYGSAIYMGNGGTIENSNFTGNYVDPAGGSSYGGTVYNKAGTLTVKDCEFEDNTGSETNFNIFNQGKTPNISSTTFKTISPTVTVENVGNYVTGSGKFDIGVNNYPIKIILKVNDTDNTQCEATVTNGEFTFSMDKPNPGTYTLTIDSIDNAVTYNTIIMDAESDEFTVDKHPVNLTVPSTVIAAHELQAKIRISLTDENGNPLNGEVTIYINGENETVPINNGVGYYKKSGLDIDEYPFKVTYNGTDIYQNATEFGTLIVEDIDINHTYTQLQKFIDETPEGETLVLPYYFRYTDDIDGENFPTGVVIDKPITIDGNGSYISGEHLYRIFNITSDNVVLKNIIFTNGSADNGGAIHVASTGSASLDNCTFENNTATNKGGAVYCDNKITVSDSTFVNNSAKDGGAIFTKDSSIDKSKFYNNSVSDHGGGLFSEGKSIVTNSVFDNNNVTEYKRIERLNRGGAAIYSTGELEIDHTNITNNLKDYVERGYVNSYLGYGAVAFTNNTKISNSLFENNNGCYGGAISAGVNFYEDFADYTFDIDNVTFNNNEAYDGGAIYVSTSNNNLGILFAEDIIFTVSNSTFNNNSAGYVGNTGFSAAGGAICVVGNKGYGNVTSSNFTNNYAHSHINAAGGAISLEDTRLNIDDCDFSDNYANKGGAIEFSDNHLSITSVVVNNSNIDNNTAKTKGGGAIYYAFGNLTILNSNLTNNKAIDYNGGAIYHGDDLYVSDCNFINNTANQGGAISSSYVKNLEIYNSSFESNNASNTYGGAIYSYGTTDGIISNSNFTDNSANTIGGAVFAYTGSKLAIEDTNFVNNTANTNAGGAYVYSISDVSITDSNFTENKANSNGGGLYLYNTPDVDITGDTFTANNATTSGGAIYAYGADNIDIKDSDFSENVANSYGGAIYSRNSGVDITDNSKFDSNTANYGGAIYGNNINNLNIDGADFTNNSAKTYAGAIYLTGSSTPANISDAYFNKNTASYGSAIFLNNGELYVSDTEFGRNRANSASLTLDVTTPVTYSPGNVTAKVVYKGCDNIANAIWNNGPYTNVYVSNITYEVYIKGNHYNKTTPAGFINPANGANENAEVWQSTLEDAQIINFIITPLDNPDNVIVNETRLTDVYGNITNIFRNLAPGKYNITALHPLDDYYTFIKTSGEFEVFDIDVNKTTNDVKVNRGENVTYNITVNTGSPKDLSDITVVDYVPNGFILMDYSAGWQLVSQNDNKITFKYIANNGVLESGKTISLILVFNTTIGGTYNNTVSVSSNETANKEVNSSNSTTVLVPTHITVGNITTYPGTEVVIPINVTTDDGVPFDGNVTIIFPDGSNETVQIIKGSGTATWVVPDEYVPSYGDRIRFEGEGQYLPSDAAGTISVVQIPTKIIVGNVTTYPGRTVTIPIQVTADNGVPFNGKVTIYLPDGSKKTVEIVNGKGSVKWTVPKDYVPGLYDDNVKFAGDGKYLPSEGKGTVKVLKIPVKITVGSVTAKPGQKVTIPIKVTPKYGPKFNGKIKVTLPDGTKKTVKIVNGKGSVVWTIPKDYKGTYDVSASFGGNTVYYPAKGAGKIKVIVEKPAKQGDDKKIKSSNVKTALQSNETGNPVFLLVCIFALLLNISIRRR